MIYSRWKLLLVRKDRAQLPNWFIRFKLDVGDAKYLIRNNILAVHWKDKHDVFSLSAIHNPGETVIQRYKGDVPKPNMIIDYNKHMGGVDKCDQYLSYYNICHKSVKWWKKVFFRLLELCIINSMCFETHIAYTKQRNSHLNFRETLIHQLVQDHLNKREEEEPTRGFDTLVVSGRRKVTTKVRSKHYVSRHEKRRKCSLCSYKKDRARRKRKETKTFDFCKKCNAHVCKKKFTELSTIMNFRI